MDKNRMKPNQPGNEKKKYEQETAAEIGANRLKNAGRTATVPTGYTIPNKMNQEFADEMDTFKNTGAGKDRTTIVPPVTRADRETSPGTERMADTKKDDNKKTT
ncbi:MAG: hypothetical protein HPY74_15920 [Firmicutes bacterium]|nr:hypothetical protein [Bacillota bacterium]